MGTKSKSHWFEAKEYGFGWGLPTCWQGWAVLGAFCAATFGGMFIFPPHLEEGRYGFYLVAISVVLIVICWIKGPKARWRWGYDDLEVMSKRQAAAASRKREKEMLSKHTQDESRD